MTHFDQLETRDPEQRERAQFALMPDFLRRTLELSPGWARHLKGVDPAAITSRQALAQLPILRKSELLERQAAEPPLGGFATAGLGGLARVFVSPGPIFEPEGHGSDWWRTARALHAAGLRKGDIVHNTFAYHLTPGGWILDAGARALGCAVIAAGPGNTEQQLDAIAHLKPTAYVGVPDYLKILLDKAKEAGRDASSITKAVVSGGALFPSLRAEYQSRGVDTYQVYATADLGIIAYESTPREGMIVDEGVIVEIVRPGTGDPVPEGDVGEVVVTSFNRDYPMIRLATGDMSAVLSGPSPCGRTNMRIKGWLGRADQTTKVKGMFVRPEQIAELARRHPKLGRLRLVVGRAGEQDTMTLKAESADVSSAAKASIAETLQALTKLKGEVELVPPGSLPNDGKVIADERSYG
ncbi:MAG: phenylacetate--CoA ligase family protein [Hyphomicrobiales bacterium]|nr:MAG: phenylacetate--CoA ligase family protein [Hyphomicrobiales bacterium]